MSSGEYLNVSMIECSHEVPLFCLNFIDCFGRVFFPQNVLFESICRFIFLVLFHSSQIEYIQVTWKNIHFLMWDIGGQESLRTSWPTYYSNTEVSVYYSSDEVPL